MRSSVAFALLFLLSSCALFQPEDRFGAAPVTYASLSGWPEDNHAAALRAFMASCEAPPRPPAAPAASGLFVPEDVRQSLCLEAARTLPAAARDFFERRFAPYRITNRGREQGLFTGYYEPVLYGARRRGGDFQHPLYLAPSELEKQTPYYTHAEINGGALDGRGLELVWVDDPVMRFFLHVQGSGRIKFSDRTEWHVGYAGKNGQPYRSLGKIMGEEGLLPKGDINFFTIRTWLYQNRDQAFALMERNPSYVFFTRREKPGAVGASGAILTPLRSLAVDSRYIPYGLPLFLDTELPAQPQQQPAPFRHLLMAQDTGGAIKGPVRGDIFFGPGDEAEYFAGYMAANGVYTLLVPREIVGQVRIE